MNVEKTSTSNVVTTTAAKTNVAATMAASAATTAVGNKDTRGNKIEAELCPGLSTNTEDKFADSTEFLAPIKELIKAYNIYIAQYDSLASKNKWTWTEIDKFWEQVGECHKRLPQYVLQEFFGPTSFDPVPEFNTEPSRGECRYLNNVLLNLDELGDGSSCGLYKGRLAAPGGTGAIERWGVTLEAGARRSTLDPASINRLCELREADLRNTFDYLQKLESALTLIPVNKIPRIGF